MTNRHRIWIEHAGGRIAVARWGDADAGKPAALLVHGTGFVAEVWDEVARELAHRYTVYGIDRRGHGASHKPSCDQYHFLDFASDVCAVIEALDLNNIFGIGHSAGATDLLLAARLLPGRFSRLFVMEPTIMDPRARADGGLSDKAAASVQGTLRRQPEFDSATMAFNRYRAAPAFAVWSEGALWAYVRHGFETLPDGRVRLSCRPEIEAAMLRRAGSAGIVAASSGGIRRRIGLVRRRDRAQRYPSGLDAPPAGGFRKCSADPTDVAQQGAHARVRGQTDRRNIGFRGPQVRRGIP